MPSWKPWVCIAIPNVLIKVAIIENLSVSVSCSIIEMDLIWQKEGILTYLETGGEWPLYITTKLIKICSQPFLFHFGLLPNSSSLIRLRFDVKFDSV